MKHDETNSAWQDLETELFGPLYNTIWDRFDADFDFKPSTRSVDWPGIREPTPSVTYSISSIYNQGEKHFLASNDEINLKALRAFRCCVNPADQLYVLDWQHVAYLFAPHAPDAHIVSEWKLSLLPDGDYYIFLDKQFRFGTFGHPWEQSICIFGQPLLDAFQQDLPQAFQKMRSR